MTVWDSPWAFKNQLYKEAEIIPLTPWAPKTMKNTRFGHLKTQVIYHKKLLPMVIGTYRGYISPVTHLKAHL